MEAFKGKWKLLESDKFEEFMSAIGVGFLLRKTANNLTPLQIITLNDDKLHIKTETAFKTTELEFRLDEEFEEKTADGRVVKTKVVLEDGKLVQIQPGKAEAKITREIKDGKYVMKLECNDIVCTRVYRFVGPVE